MSIDAAVAGRVAVRPFEGEDWRSCDGRNPPTAPPQCVITHSSFRRAIHTNGSNYAEIKNLSLSERLQTRWRATEIGAPISRISLG